MKANESDCCLSAGDNPVMLLLLCREWRKAPLLVLRIATSVLIVVAPLVVIFLVSTEARY